MASSAGRPPAVNQAIFDAYAAWYPGWHVALCCFERSFEAVEPLLWWYEPIDSTRLFAPSLDGHDGKVPHPGAAVDVDHKLVFGSVTKPEGRDAIFTDYTKVAPDRSGLRTELPDDLRALPRDQSDGCGLRASKDAERRLLTAPGAARRPRLGMRVSPPGA